MRDPTARTESHAHRQRRGLLAARDKCRRCGGGASAQPRVAKELRRRRPRCGALVEEPKKHVAQARRDGVSDAGAPNATVAWQLQRATLDRRVGGVGGRAVKGQAAKNPDMDADAEGPHVGGRAEPVATRQALGGAVRRRPKDAPRCLRASAQRVSD